MTNKRSFDAINDNTYKKRELKRSKTIIPNLKHDTSHEEESTFKKAKDKLELTKHITKIMEISPFTQKMMHYGDPTNEEEREDEAQHDGICFQCSLRLNVKSVVSLSCEHLICISCFKAPLSCNICKQTSYRPYPVIFQ